jgi:hypothetical protein
MPNKIIQPFINPIKFIELTPTLQDQYRSRHYDDFFYMETIKQWQEKRQYLQPWQQSDSIRWQFQSQMAPMKYSLIDMDERVYVSNNMSDLLQNADDPDFRVYQGDLALAPYDPGIYFVRIDCGTADGDGNFPLVLISEPLIIAEEHKNTLYLEYKGAGYYGSVVWGTGFSPNIRIRATLRPKSFSSKDTFFEDEEMGMTLLDARPYEVYELIIGGATGIPDYLAKIINRILGCKTLQIDGRYYTKNDGAKLEESAQENYPMRAYKIELRDASGKNVRTYENDAVQLQGITIVATEDAKGFSLNDGNSEEQIQEFI